jgi:hypothetical protein
MTSLPQFQSYSPGQIFDRSRSKIRSRCYEAPLKQYTVTIGGDATTGTYSFTVDGTTVSYAANTGAGDTNTTIAVGLQAAALSNSLGVLEVAAVSRNALVITLTGRETGDSFTVAGATAPAPGTLTIANPEDGVEGNLELGIGVALDDSDPLSIRRPMSGDTKIFGVVCEGGGIRKSTGDSDDVDSYAPGAAVDVGRCGPFPVVVEEAVSAGDSIYCRMESDTGFVQGNFRNDSGAVSQITTGTVVANNSDTVGLTIDSLPSVTVTSTADATATAVLLRNAFNARADLFALAVATSAAAVLTLTFKDFASHTVVAVSPATADVTPIANTATAVSARAVLVPGEFISDSYTDAATGKTVALADINLPA